MHHSRFHSKLYAKRGKFNFDIIKMPYQRSNIPGKMFYSAIFTVLLRIFKATNKQQDSMKSVKILIGRIIKQEVLINQMKRAPFTLNINHRKKLMITF